MLTTEACRRLSSLTSALVVVVVVLAVAGPRAAAHQIAAADSTPAAVETVSGTVHAVRIQNDVTQQSLTHRELRLDAGGSIALHGDAAASLQNGARVRLDARRSGNALEALDAQVLSIPSSSPASVEVDGTLAIAHADDFANGRSRYVYEVHDNAGGVTALNLATLPAGVHGGSRVRVVGTRSADGASVDPESITIEADTSGSSVTQSGMVAKSATANSVLVILANFNNTTAPSYTATQALAVMATNGNRWDPLESTCRHASLSIL